MPILSNQRHELFAQGLAAGKTADQAYQEAGYRANRGNATTLKANKSISNRVAEILEQAAVLVELTRADILNMLTEDRKLARENNQASAAIRATELLGRELCSMFVERKEHKVTISHEDALNAIDGDGDETIFDEHSATAH